MTTPKITEDHRDNNGNLKCGVRKPGWFNIEVWFPTLEAFKEAEQVFREAGYTVEMCPEAFDDYSDTTFGIVSKPAGTATFDELFDEALELANRLGGDADAGRIEGSE